jgi:hypothetical protein
VRPTSWRVLAAWAVVAGVGGWVLANQAYGSLISLPGVAPVTCAVIAVFELGLAKVVADQVNHRSRVQRGMHPLQVARAVALAKASSAAGAILLGLYAGLFAWTFPRRDTLAAASHDALVSGISAGAAVLLVVAALLLERGCRTPDEPEDLDD